MPRLLYRPVIYSNIKLYIRVGNLLKSCLTHNRNLRKCQQKQLQRLSSPHRTLLWWAPRRILLSLVIEVFLPLPSHIQTLTLVSNSIHMVHPSLPARNSNQSIFSIYKSISSLSFLRNPRICDVAQYFCFTEPRRYICFHNHTTKSDQGGA